jgi:hypothetical protein
MGVAVIAKLLWGYITYCQDLHIRSRGESSGSGRGKNLPLLRVVQTSSGAHPSSYTMGTRGSFSRG